MLFALWFVMSQKTEPKFIIIGLASSVMIALLLRRTLCMPGFKTGEEHYFMETSPLRMIPYLLWLLVQITKSAVYVSGISLSDKSKVDPSVAYFRADYDSPYARAMLANSITLTPGTITIDITDDGIYSVHALTQELRDGLLDGSMQQKVAHAFGEEIDFAPLSGEEIPKQARQADPEAKARSFAAHRKRRAER